MKLEGGSFVKSPWYYRTGTRPLAAVRSLSYVATNIAIHAATVRSQLSVTSTLNLYLGHVTHYSRGVVAGTNANEWGSYLTYDSALGAGFSSSLYISSSANVGTNVTFAHHLGEHLTVSGDTIYLITVDGATGAHTVNYSVVCSVEWYGK